MSEPRPLLAFAPAVAGPIPAGRPQFMPPPRTPTAARQGLRLTPQFNALQEALAAGRAQAVGVTAEPDPELVVVFDVAGTVAQFMRAAALIEGLEFLAELDEDATEPDEDFYFEIDGEATATAVPETLYMVMSNAQAVTELIRLFDLWRANPAIAFERGLAPLKQAFAMLRAVRRWGPADRIRETGLLEAWAEDVAVVGGQGLTRVEIELWFRDDVVRRTSAQADVERLIGAARGTVISSAVVPSIDYHAVLADLPYDQVQAVLERGPEAIELLTTESIMFVVPARPMTIPAIELSALAAPSFAPARDAAPPRVALLDGLPLANHTVLANRMIIDDPDERARQYNSGQQHHGTAMASLICHGDLSAPGPALSTQLYVRPIMEPHPHFDSEVIARDELLVDLLHRAFHRIFEGDGDRPAAAPSVRIVNLSIGDPARVFARRISPLARLLDWLAHLYNVLVLVSAGNHADELVVPADALNDPGTLGREVLAATYSQARQRRLLSPAEAVNVLTVGALHSDSAAVTIPDTVLDAVEAGMPAGYGAIGFGYHRSVKPEILLPGGRQLFQRPPPGTTGSVALTQARHAATGPGLLVAAPDPDGGAAATGYSCGTSNATALASRTANQIFDVLGSVTAQDGEFPFPDAQYDPVLAKAILVHAASWGQISDKLRDALALDGRTARRDITQLLGYGPVDYTRVATAARTRVVLLGAGSISHGQRHGLSLPLPPALAATTEWRRLTITLAWLSPINPRSQVHRMARLFFRPLEGQLGLERTEADHNAARRGTVQHEVLEGTAAAAFTADSTLAIDIDCRIDAGKVDAPIRYGIAVSLEMATTVRADIHAQIRQGLRVQLRQRQQITPRS